MLRSIPLLQRHTRHTLLHSCFFSTAPKDNSPTSPISQTQRISTPAQLKPISESAQMALWASLALKTIENANNPTSLQDKSLRQIIAQSELSIDGYRMDTKVRQKFMKLFNEGIRFDNNPQWFDQLRISQGSYKKLFMFCPNLLVTREVLKNLHNLESMANKMLLCGSYGISKTVSLVLVCYLTELINKFKYELWKHNRPGDQQLVKLHPQYFQLQVPRYWYWTFKERQLRDDQFNLQSIILEQASELTDEEKNSLENIKPYSKFWKQLKNKYPPNLEHRFILDHINTPASMLRNYNLLISSQKDQIKGSNLIEKQNKLMKMKELIDQYLHSEGENTSYILNSSMNIQKQLLQKEIFPLLTLNLPVISTIQLPFHENIRMLWGQIDFYHFFWFQFHKRLSYVLQPKVLSKVKDMFFQSVKNLPIKRYYRIIFMNQYLTDGVTASKWNIIDKSFSAQKVIEIINEILKGFGDFCDHQTTQKIVQFKDKLQKDDIRASKALLIDLLYLLAVENAQNNIDKMEFESSLLETLMPQGFDIYHMLLSPDHNKQLLPVSLNDKKGTIDFQWSPQEFIKLVTNRCLTVETRNFIHNFIEKSGIDIKQKPVLGQFYQAKLIELLIPDSKMKLKFLKPENLQFDEIQYEFAEKTEFQHFSGNNTTITSNMQDLIWQARKNYPKSVAGLPITKKTGENSRNSPTIDFAVATYYRDQKLTNIHTFDVTVTMLKADIQDKYEKALNLFKGLRIDNKKVLIHTIICDQQFCTPLQIRKLRKKFENLIQESKIEIRLCSQFSIKSASTNNKIQSKIIIFKWLNRFIRKRNQLKKRKDLLN